MAIELKLKRDGKHVTLKRPNTNVLELEEFEDFQDELGDIQGEYFDELQKDKTKAVSFFPYRKRIRNRQIEYIKELFEDHDAFSVEEFKTGIDSEKLDDVIVGIFQQISPADYKEDKPEGKKKA